MLLKYLPEAAQLIPPQCVTVRLEVSEVNETPINGKYLFQSVGMKKGVQRGFLRPSGLSVREQTSTEKKVLPWMNDEVAPVPENLQPEIGTICLKVGKEMYVNVLHVKSPKSIYVTPSLSEVQHFQKYLYKLASQLEIDPNFRPSVGSIVLAKAPSDKNFRSYTLK